MWSNVKVIFLIDAANIRLALTSEKPPRGNNDANNLRKKTTQQMVMEQRKTDHQPMP